MNPSNDRSARDRAPAIAILGVPVSTLDMGGAVSILSDWIAGGGEGCYVCACDVHSLMRARGDETHLRALEGAHMVTPDGQPLVWTGRARGARMGRVAGPDLLPALCRAGLERGWRHYFYGGAPGVAEELARRLASRFPGIAIAGVESPPFRRPSAPEAEATLKRIAEARADIVWVGLGCPKQEEWMAANAPRLEAVAIGIGAAFDFHAGRIARAPGWMRAGGLEWLHRLMAEPARLWRRYLWLAPRFAVAATAETLMLAARRRRSGGRDEGRIGAG